MLLSTQSVSDNSVLLYATNKCTLIVVDIMSFEMLEMAAGNLLM